MFTHRLNKKGQNIIESILDKQSEVFISNSTALYSASLLQQIRDAGNLWFAEHSLKAYVNKRRQMFQATRSQSKPGKKLEPAGPNTTVEEEEKLFGQIAVQTRTHLRWLYQVLDDEDHDHLEFWTCQTEYAVTLHEIKEYFKYLQRSGVPVFRGLTKEARLKLQGLLRGDPGADQRKYKIWAKRIGVDDVDAVSAFVRHLQEFMHVKPISNGRRTLTERNRTPVASSSASARNLEPLSASALNVIPEPVLSSASTVPPESALKSPPSLQLGNSAEVVEEPEIVSFSDKPHIDSRSCTPTPLFKLQARIRDPIPAASAQFKSDNDQEAAPMDSPNCPSRSPDTLSSSISNVAPEPTPVSPASTRPSPVVEHFGRPEIAPIRSESQIESRSKGIPTPLSRLQVRIHGSTPAARTQIDNNIDRSATRKDTCSIGTPEPVSPSASVVTLEPVSTSVSGVAPESVPKSSPTRTTQPSPVARLAGRPKDASISSEPHNELQGKVIPTPLSRLQARIRNSVSVATEVNSNNIGQQTTAKGTSKDSPSVRASTEHNRPPTPEDPFKLFVDHPLRVQGPSTREHRIRLVPVLKRDVAAPGRQSAVLRIWDSAVRIEVVPTASEKMDHDSQPAERNSGLNDSPGIIANETQPVEHPFELPGTPPGSWDDVSTPPIVTIEEEDIDMIADNVKYENDDGEGELAYPQDEHDASQKWKSTNSILPILLIPATSLKPNLSL